MDSIARPGPLLYTVDTQLMDDEWKECFQHFWSFIVSEWRRYSGAGWRGLLSRLATLMTAFDVDGQDQLGGRDPDMPLSKIASPREGNFNIPFSASVYSKIIKPFCDDLAVSVAYIPPGAGAIYYPSGKVRKSQLGDRFLSARRELLNSNKRVLVDLRQVSDPEYRAELERVGVKPSPVNSALLGSPGIGHELLKPDIKPRRAPTKPKVVRASPLTASVKLTSRTPALGKAETGPAAMRKNGVGLGIATAGALVTSASLLGLHWVLSDCDRE